MIGEARAHVDFDLVDLVQCLNRPLIRVVSVAEVRSSVAVTRDQWKK